MLIAQTHNSSEHYECSTRWNICIDSIPQGSENTLEEGLENNVTKNKCWGGYKKKASLAVGVNAIGTDTLEINMETIKK